MRPMRRARGPARAADREGRDARLVPGGGGHRPRADPSHRDRSCSWPTITAASSTPPSWSPRFPGRSASSRWRRCSGSCRSDRCSRSQARSRSIAPRMPAGTGAGARGNLDAFDACFAHLRDGGAIGIFPEGEASDEAHLLPIRTGAARIALGAHSRGAMGLRIVPVGLIYEDKQRARSRAYVRVGRADRAGLGPRDESGRSARRDRPRRGRVAHEHDRGTAGRCGTRLPERGAAIGPPSGGERRAPMGARGPSGTAARRRGGAAGRPFVRSACRPRRKPSAPRRSSTAKALAAAGVSDAVVAPGAGEALLRRSRFGWLLTLALAPARRDRARGQRGPRRSPCTRSGRRPMPPVTHATAKFLDGDRALPRELGSPQVVRVRRHHLTRGSSPSPSGRSAASPPCGASGGRSGRGGRGWV